MTNALDEMLVHLARRANENSRAFQAGRKFFSSSSSLVSLLHFQLPSSFLGVINHHGISILSIHDAPTHST